MNKKNTETQIVPSFTPDMSKVMSATVTKKDIIEIFEVEAEEKIEAELESIKNDITQYDIDINKQYEKERNLIKVHTDKVCKLELSQVKKLVKLVNPDFKEEEIKLSYRVSNETMSLQIWYSFELDKLPSEISFHHAIKFPEELLEQLLPIREKIAEMNKSRCKLYDQKYKLQTIRANLPKHIKKMSAHLTKSMLMSNKNGKDLIGLIKQNQILLPNK